MANYHAPLQDFKFLYEDVFRLTDFWQQSEKFKDSNNDMIMAILNEGEKLCQEFLLPYNYSGDQQGCQFNPETHSVTTPLGFQQASQAWSEGGWFALNADEKHGGLGLPKTVGILFDEMMYATNCAFTLYVGLTQGAADLIAYHASEQLKQLYLPKLLSGEYCGTMCLTEAHAGTNLADIKSKATQTNTGSFLIEGNKIFISSGEHDLSTNIIHLVLARIHDAPAGHKGLSLFLVPKFLENNKRNSVFCTSIEHKMGIKGNATCSMHFSQAQGFLIGQAHHGLQQMFTMMNYERLSISMQGVGLASIAFQNSRDYAVERQQGKNAYGDNLFAFADVRHQLLQQKCFIEYPRALAVHTAHYLDHYKDTKNSLSAKRAALLTPVVKAFLTDRGLESCLLGQQVYGGHGYISETGAEQYVRDARIAQIYEGTNGIQALDFLSRKVLADQAVTLKKYIEELQIELEQMNNKQSLQLVELLQRFLQLTQTLSACEQEQDFLVNAVCKDYLDCFAYILMGYFAVRFRQAVNIEKHGPLFFESKHTLCDYYFDKILPRCDTLIHCIRTGARSCREFKQAYLWH